MSLGQGDKFTMALGGAAAAAAAAAALLGLAKTSRAAMRQKPPELALVALHHGS